MFSGSELFMNFFQKFKIKLKKFKTYCGYQWYNFQVDLLWPDDPCKNLRALGLLTIFLPK